MTTSERVPAHDIFLDADERYDVFNVKLAERPHLARSCDSCGQKEYDTEAQPLSDGCDIPGWRTEEIVSIGNELSAILNVGTACSLRRRESQLVPLPVDLPDEWEKKQIGNVEHKDSHAEGVPRIDIRKACEIFRDEESKRSFTRFAVDYERPNTPVIIENATSDWPAATTWSLENFSRRFKDINWRFSDLHGEMMTMGTYYKYMHGVEGGTDDSPLAIYDSEFGNESSPTSCLLAEYSIPPCFSQDLFECVPDACDRPPFRWILAGPARSGTGMHIDPLYTNAWVTLLEGRKHWMLFPPQAPLDEIGMCQGNAPQLASVVWFKRYYEVTVAGSHNWKPVEIIQEPGETVFVPCGWPHVVLNLKPSLAVTHNYACEFHLDKIIQDVKELEPEFYDVWIPALRRHYPELFASVA